MKISHFTAKKIKLSQLGLGDIFIIKPLQIPYRGIKYIFCQSGEIEKFDEKYFVYKSFNMEKTYFSMKDLEVTLVGTVRSF